MTKRIQELLSKIRIHTCQNEGEAHWMCNDLLGDQHNAVIAWTDQSLTITKNISSSVCVNHWFLKLQLSETGRLRLVSSGGFEESVSGVLATFAAAQKDLENGPAPQVVSPPSVQGLSL